MIADSRRVTKTIGLREFQQQLAERIRVAASQSAPSARLGVQAGSRNWLIRLDDAGEVLPLPPISPVPLTVPWFIGLANIRGNLACIIDFAAFMGESPRPSTAECRLLLVAERYGAHSGLMVSRVIGLRNLGELQAEERGADRAWVGAAWRERDGTRWQELNVGALVIHDDFLRVGV